MSKKIMKMINQVIRRGSGVNLNLFRYAAMVVVLMLGVSNAWAGGGSSNYYASLKINEASGKPTGAGSVYVANSNSKPGSANAGTAVQSSATTSSGGNVTMYWWVDINPGYNVSLSGKVTGGPYSAASANGNVSCAASTSKNGVQAYTATATFVEVTVNSVDAASKALAPTNPSIDYPFTVTFATSNLKTIALDLNKSPETADGKFTITSWAQDGNNVVATGKFNGGDSYGGASRNNSTTVSLQSKASGSAAKTCTVTANFPAMAFVSVEADDVFATQGESGKTGAATFKYNYAAEDDFPTTPTLTPTNGTGAFTVTGYTVTPDFAKGETTVTVNYSFDTNNGIGETPATLTLTAANGDVRTVTVTGHSEALATNDASVTTTANVTTEYATFAQALAAANATSGATLTLLRNVDLGTITATNNINKAMTIDLNGKELRAAVNATSVGILTIAKAVAVTIKDSKTGGKIINEIARNSEIRTIFVNKAGATLTLESGTIAVNNLGQYASAANSTLGVAKYASCAARAINQCAGSTVNINGGRVEAFGTRNAYGIYQESSVATNNAGTSVLNISGGEVYAEAPYGVYGINGYGKINFSNGDINVKINTKMVDARYAADHANNTKNGLAYGILVNAYSNATASNCYFGTLNMTGGNVNVTNERVLAADLKSYGVLINCSNADMGANTAVDGSKCQKAAAKGSIDGGTITVNSGTYYSFGVYMSGSYNSYDNTSHVLTVKNCTINVKAHTYAYGVFSQGAVNTTNGGCYHGDIELTNCTVTAETTVGAYSYAAFVTSRVATIYKNASTAAANYYHGEYGSAGKLTINSGTYKAYAKTTTAYCVSAGNEWSGEARAKTTYADETNVALTQLLGGNVEAYPTLIIHGGDFYAETFGTTTARAVSSGGYTTIDGGTFKAVAKTNNAYGLVAVSGTMKVTGVTVETEGDATVYGVLVNAGISDYTLFDYSADVELNNCDVTATTRTGTEARGVSVVATTKTQTEAQKETLKTNGTKEGATSTQKNNYNNYYNIYQVGEKAVAGKVKISGGTYRATAATTTAYGAVISTTAVSATGAASASPEGIIKNATFVVKTNGTTSATGIYAGGPITIEGCNITVQPQTTTGYGVYINDKKTTISNTTINVTTANTADATKSAAAYGVYNNASISSIGWIFEGELEANEGNVVDVKTTSGTTAYGVYTHAVNKAITSEVYTTAGTYVAAARTTINGGKYTAHAKNTTGYAVVVADPVLGTEVTGIPTCIINGGKFKGTAASTPYADVHTNGETGYFVLNGGYYVKDENLDKKLGEGMNKVAVKSGTPEYTEGYRWRVTDNMTGEAVCKITQNSTSYASLEEALQVVNASPNSTWTIVMTANYTLSKGDYEIPANTTLLIPYKSGQTTINGATPAWVDKRDTPTPTTPSPYMKLTFANGVNMTVKGKIEASSTTYINQNNWTGVPGGPYGWLQLNEGSHIDLESGAYLFAWGYVTGTGDINAKNGSYIYEDFQMGDWRGGTMGSSVNGNKNGLGSKGVFLLTDYYFQNVECPITYRPGAQSIAYSGCYMEKPNYGLYIQGKSDPVTMVGTSGAMFLMNPATAGENTWVRKEYDAEKDQLVWTLNSGASLGSFRLKISASFIDVDMNTTDYVLPMATNFKIVANEGDINITNDICFLPGSEAIVKKEANLVVPTGKRVFIYDADDWSSYGGYFHKIGYSPSWKACPRLMATSTKLADAKIEVAGTLDIQGSLYTTAGGGNIFSTRENAGKLKLGSAAPASTSAIADFTGNSGQNKTLCQLVGNGSEGHYVGKALTAAKLKNEDGSYTPTTGAASGDIYAYMEDPSDGVYRWLSVKDVGCFTEIKGADTKQYIHPSDFVAVEANANGDHAYHNEGSTRYFVNAEAASGNASCVWWEAEPKGIIDGVTYYMANNENFDNYGTYFYWDNSVSYWKPKKITVTWKDKDGNKITNGSFGDSYSFNTSPQFYGTNPTWANTSTEKHDWIGWRDEDGNIYDKNATLPAATADETVYTAYFETSKYQYTITFKNDDNSDLWAGLVDAGTTGAELQALFETKYNEKTGSTIPLKASSVDKVYTFSGWDNTLATVTAAATYTASYTWVTRQYHVTFYNYDAASVLYETDVEYNKTRPVYGGVTPFRANTSAFSYEWTGWQQGATHYGTTDNLALVTGDVYYVATFSQTDLKYQVLFKRQDGSIIDAPFFNYEETPAAFPANPTLASTVSTDYTFDHWDPATLQPVTVDGMVYTAHFSESSRQYTAHFVNYDGTSLGVDQTIDYNTVPAYTGATPFKPNDSRNSFDFSGWAWEAGADWAAGSIGVGEAFPAIKGDITFTAQFTETLLQFNIIYKREDGTVIEQQKKKWGESTAFPSVSNYEDATHTYTFDHWSPATVVTPVTTDATYTAYFNQAIKTYSISNFGISPAGYGTVSPASVTGIPSGSSVTVNGNKITVNGQTITATPTATDAQYTYEFDHWNNVPATVTANVTNIEAVFTRTVNTYTVTWKNGGVTLETDENVVYGTTPTYDGATPTKTATAEWTYEFAGWDNEVVAVTGDVTYNATFNQTKNSYEITWLNDDNSLIDKTTVEYGVVPTHADATKANTAEWIYEFAGWDNTPVAVTGTATYKATFTATKNNYTLTIGVNEAGYGSVNESSVTVPYGTSVSTSGNVLTIGGTTITATPTANTAKYSYAFIEWLNVPATVTGNISDIEAVFTRTVNQYDVTFNMKGHGAAISKQTKEYGSKVDQPADPSEAGYTFVGWYKEDACTNAWNFASDEVTGATTLYAKWTVNPYTITFDSNGGSSVASITQNYGTAVTPPANPTRTGYTFAGWLPEVPATMPVDGETCVAQWTINSYQINFVDEDGTTNLGSYPQNLDYGAAVTAPEEPTKAADATNVYTFAGWSDGVNTYASEDIPAVSEAVTYKATYNSAPTVASVTVGGATTYYATLQAAFDYAADKTTPTIKVLNDVSGITTQLKYTNTSKTTVTIDLNGHTVAGKVNQLLYLTSASSTGGTVVIKSSVGGGQIQNVLSSTSARSCVYLYKGKLKLESGTIYCQNTNTGASYALQTAASRTFTMTGGHLESKGQKNVYALYSAGTSNVSGGRLVASDTKTGTVAGVCVIGGTTTISGSAEIEVNATTSAYGARVSIQPSTSGGLYTGTLNITGGTFNVHASTSSAVGVYSYAGTRAINEKGNYACAGTANISGGEFTVTSDGAKAYGVYVTGTVSIATAKDADGKATYAAASATSKANVTGGKFNVSGTSDVMAVNTSATNTDLVVEGGWYNINTNLDGYTAPTKSCNYHVLDLADEDPYLYEVAEAYTITFKDGDDNPIQSGLVEKGQTPAYTGATPTKTATAQYTYTFNNTWSPAITSVTGAATYTAQFGSTVNKYDITWVDGNGATLKTEQVEYGQTPNYTGATPTKTATDQYTYTFNNTWSPAITAVTGAATYTAQFGSTVNKYTITWVDGNGATLKTEQVEYGQTPAYIGETPTKTATDQYTYTFNNTWSPAIVAVTGAATYTAQFGSTVNKYTITWVDGNGATLKTEQVEYGQTPVYTGETPTKTATDQYTYTFNNTWSPAIVAVTGAATYTAQFGSTVNKYTITWVDDNGATLKTEQVEYGATPAYTGETPTKTATAQYTYSFSGWDPAISAVTADATYTAQFNEIPQVYAVTLHTNEGTINADDVTSYTYGVGATLPTYVTCTGKDFAGWYDNSGLTGSAVTAISTTDTGDKEYWARWVESMYTITWLNWNGDPLGNPTTIHHGGRPAYKTFDPTPTRGTSNGRTYAWDGWTTEAYGAGTFYAKDSLPEASGNATYYAHFRITDIVVSENDVIKETTDVETTTVHVAGKLTVTSGTLTTTNLILEGTPTSSGEIVGNVVASQKAYFDFSNGTEGFKARTWYAVAVPWQVSVTAYAEDNGVYIKNGSDDPIRQTMGTTFDLIYYDGARRADGAVKAWNFVEDDQTKDKKHYTMEPGRAYMIYLTSNAQTIRFERKEGAELHTTQVDTKKYAVSPGVNPDYADWNGIANPATYHAYLNVGATENIGQVYVAETKQYKQFNMSDSMLVVGQPIFVQPKTAKTIVASDTYGTYASAPRRSKAWSAPLTRYELMLAASEADVTDRVIVRMDEDKEEDSYTVGQDLAKMGVSSVVPQMWIDRYDSKMCINTVAPVNNTADYPMGISVQKDGEYELFIDDQPNDETMLYLTYDGEAIWNLSYGGYVATLTKGENTHYGLRIVYTERKTPTGIEQTTIQNGESIRKVLVDDKVFIIRGNNVYSIDGQLVK